MNIEKAQLVPYCFRLGSILSVLALFLPSTYTASTSSDGFASGLFSGTWYGIEDLLFLCFLPPVGLTLLALLVAQIKFAFKPSSLYPSIWPFTRWLFYLLSILLLFGMGADIIEHLRHIGYYRSELLIGFYFYAIGTLFTTTGLFLSRTLAASEEKNNPVDP
ncbi:MAG TPA: hypothetical protein VFO76_05900 [Candidatus Kapabacteria bacterium]|nr:hypothetical protein [Candidatus Kapabacteria bacterium]